MAVIGTSYTRASQQPRIIGYLRQGYKGFLSLSSVFDILQVRYRLSWHKLHSYLYQTPNLLKVTKSNIKAITR